MYLKIKLKIKAKFILKFKINIKNKQILYTLNKLVTFSLC